MAALFHRWRRNFGIDQARGGVFFEQAGRLACAWIATNPAGGRIGSIFRDASSFQRERIGDGHVAVHSGEDHGILGRDCVEIFASWVALIGPERLIPSEAGDPFAGFVIFQAFADALLELSERADAGKTDRQSRHGGLADVHVRVVESGHDELLAQIDDASVRADEGLDGWIVDSLSRRCGIRNGDD